jgi:hypothetical protein
MAKGLFALSFQEHTFLTLLIFLAILPLFIVLNGSSFFHWENLVGEKFG